MRREAYQGRLSNDDDETTESARALDELFTAVRGVDIGWQAVPAGSPLVGSTLASTNMRQLTGASVVAIVRDGELVTNPAPETLFHPGDWLGLIGTSQEIIAVQALLKGTADANS